MTRPAMTLDELERRRQRAVANLSRGKRGYAMKALVAYDVLTQDMPALLEVARAAEGVTTTHELTAHALSVSLLAQALARAYAPKELVLMEEED